ncbi:MAG: DUF3667 domain-containing protein [Cyclobacteriaceae bacterium]
MEEPTFDPTECSNCHTKTSGAYCQQCGQSTSVHRITFHETLGDFFSSTFALEGQLLTTIKLMVVNPGKLFREFIGGKRKSYYKPVAFFVVLTALYLIVRALVDYNPIADVKEIQEGPGKKFAVAGQYMFAHINHIMILLVFSIGLNQKLFFWRKYNLAEYVAVGFYIAGFYTLLGVIQMLINAFIYPVPSQLVLVILVAVVFYASLSLHQKKSFRAFVKYFFATLLTLILYLILGYGFSFLMVSF